MKPSPFYSNLSDSLIPKESCLTLCDPMTVAHQAPLSIEFSSKNTGVSCISFSRGSFPPRNQTLVSCIGRQVLYHLSHRGSPIGSS